MDVRALLEVLDFIAPRAAAASWDNPGLQVGDVSAPVSGIMLALESDLDSLAAAESAGANVLCCHHPLFYRPMSTISADDPVGAIVLRAASLGISIIASHTDLDSASGGVNDVLASMLGIVDVEPIVKPSIAAGATSSDMCKLVVFVPVAHTQKIIDALSMAGAGRIGAYSRCSFRTPGIGGFLPDDGASPYAGTPGVPTEEPEDRVEMLIPSALLSSAVSALLAVHPYEEPAFDIYPLVGVAPPSPVTDHSGLGRIGQLIPPRPLGEALSQWCAALGVPTARVIGDAGRIISRVAVCGGSASSVVGPSIALGADVVVGGELSYHDWLAASHHDIALVALGHDVTEAPVLAPWAEAIRSALAAKGCALPVDVYDGAASPWRWETPKMKAEPLSE